jgi:hypothetical protein
LRLGIARGRSCTSILVFPRTKSSLVDAFLDGQPLPDLTSIDAMVSSPEKEERGRRKERSRVAWLLAMEWSRGHGGGWGGCRSGARPCSWWLLLCSVLCQEERKREKRKEEGKEKMGNFSKLGNFWKK